MLVLSGGMRMLREEGALPCRDSLVVPVLHHPQCADGSRAAVMCPHALLDTTVRAPAQGWSRELLASEQCQPKGTLTALKSTWTRTVATCKGGRTSVCPRPCHVLAAQPCVGPSCGCHCLNPNGTDQPGNDPPSGALPRPPSQCHGLHLGPQNLHPTSLWAGWDASRGTGWALWHQHWLGANGAGACGSLCCPYQTGSHKRTQREGLEVPEILS